MSFTVGKVQAQRCQGSDSWSSSAGSAPEPVDRIRHCVVELLSHSDYSVRRWTGRVGKSTCLNRPIAYRRVSHNMHMVTMETSAMGAVRIRHSIREFATQPVILWIPLGGKPKWLPLNFGFNDVMRTAPIGWPPWLITLLYLWIWRNHVNAQCMSMYKIRWSRGIKMESIKVAIQLHLFPWSPRYEKRVHYTLEPI